MIRGGGISWLQIWVLWSSEPPRVRVIEGVEPAWCDLTSLRAARWERSDSRAVTRHGSASYGPHPLKTGWSEWNLHDNWSVRAPYRGPRGVVCSSPCNRGVNSDLRSSRSNENSLCSCGQRRENDVKEKSRQTLLFHCSLPYNIPSLRGIFLLRSQVLTLFNKHILRDTKELSVLLLFSGINNVVRRIIIFCSKNTATAALRTCNHSLVKVGNNSPETRYLCRTLRSKWECSENPHLHWIKCLISSVRCELRSVISVIAENSDASACISFKIGLRSGGMVHPEFLLCGRILLIGVFFLCDNFQAQLTTASEEKPKFRVIREGKQVPLFRSSPTPSISSIKRGKLRDFTLFTPRPHSW